ncbi:MAG: lipoyl domain-containing protein [Candidatus Hydrogenedentes bacterium]|nr:lipoyl domain-containing protein [Candidatus Hydrogenedentota bacterium]
MEYKVFLPSEVVPDAPDINIQLTQWLCKTGDYVVQGDDIAEVTTDKAVYIVTSPVSGIIDKILVEEGNYLDPRQPICVIQMMNIDKSP